jgi:hypothetical protein
MIYIQNTPNNTGVSIYGDHMDFDNLYNALFKITGEEGEKDGYQGACLRVLGLCYDIRHALMGDREIEFVDNGMDKEKSKRMGILAPVKNLYMKINVLWPEILFVTMTLNDLIRLYAKKQSKKIYDQVLDKKNIWDPNIATVRMFQAEIAKCLKEIVTEATYNRVISTMNGDYPLVRAYCTQYIDFLNISFLDMSKEKRLKSISTMARRIAERDEGYRELKEQVYEAAKRSECAVDDIGMSEMYPEEVEW